MTEVFRAAIAKSGVEPALVEDIVVGNTLSQKGAYEVRSAALAAGFPDTTTTMTVNRLCAADRAAVLTTQLLERSHGRPGHRQPDPRRASVPWRAG